MFHRGLRFAGPKEKAGVAASRKKAIPQMTVCRVRNGEKAPVRQHLRVSKAAVTGRKRAAAVSAEGRNTEGTSPPAANSIRILPRKRTGIDAAGVQSKWQIAVI